MRRILATAAVVVLSALVSVASPAQAASGPWSVVSGGAFHTCAVNSEKSLYCWGYNQYGQVGDGTNGNARLSPTKIGSSGVWATVSAGGAHTCAVTTGKSLYCWGFNDSGQIGDGTSGPGNDRVSPKKIGSSGVWTGVAVGGAHTCAVTTGKSLYCWGNNTFGQVGDGTTSNDRPSPKKIGTSGVWTGVTGGGLHTCAVTTGKSLYCWGYNALGQIGDGSSGNNRPLPKKVGSTGVWSLADAGDTHTCGVTTGNSLYCWGGNDDGQIGDGTSGNNRPAPKKIGTSGAWARVSAGGGGGGNHTCGVTTGNSLYCWGQNLQGQIGDGTIVSPRLAPKKVGTSGVWGGVATGGLHTCAISTGKSLYCWGFNGTAAVGDGTTTDPRPSPVKVP